MKWNETTTNKNPNLDFLTGVQPLLTLAGLFIAVMGVLFYIAIVLDVRRASESGRVRQVSSIIPALAIGLGIGLMIMTRLPAFLSSLLVN